MGVSAFTNPIAVDFGQPFGTKPCIPMYLEELKDLPNHHKSLQNLGFYIAGFHWFVDWLILSLVMMMLYIFPWTKRSMGRLLWTSLRACCQPPYRTILQTKTSSSCNLTISHQDAYALTGIPAAATMIQYVQGRFWKELGPTVHFQGAIVETHQFFQDMERMGATINTAIPE